MDNMNKEKDRETQIKVAMIHARDNDTNAKLNLAKGMRELDIKDKEVALKAREQDGKAQTNRDNANLKREESRAKERMARAKNKADIQKAKKSKKSSDK